MNIYVLAGTKSGFVISKEDIKTTTEILRIKGIEMYGLDNRGVKDRGFWLDTNDQIEMVEGDLKEVHGVHYMRLNDKNKRYYFIEEIIKMRKIDIEQGQKEILVIFKSELVRLNYLINYDIQVKQISLF